MSYLEAFSLLKREAFTNMNAEEIIENLTFKKELWRKIIVWLPDMDDNLSQDVISKVGGNFKNVIIINLESSNKNDGQLFELVNKLNPRYLKIFPGTNTVYELYFFSPDIG